MANYGRTAICLCGILCADFRVMTYFANTLALTPFLWIGYIDGIGLFWCKGEEYFDLLLTTALYPLEWVQWSILSGLHISPIDAMLELS